MPWLFVLLLFAATSAGTADAAVHYVDGNCPSSGTGATTACGSTGPKKTIAEGLALLASPGDVLMIRGAHAAHNGESGAFDGRYHTDGYNITFSGSASSPIVIQPYGYTGPGTGEKVFIDGTLPPSTGWTQCSNCTTGTCAGIPSGGCSQTWYAGDSGLSRLVIGAQKDDGSPTYRVASPSDMTNSHANYNAKRCSLNTWKACDADSDCGTGETCTATSPEIDSYSPQDGGPILVRWGTTLPARPYVYASNRGGAFAIQSGSSNVVIRGLNLRCFRRSPLAVLSSSTVRNVVFRDNRIFYAMDVRANGSDYGVAVYGSTGVTIDGNEIAYTGSEGIHTDPLSTGSVLTITGNYIHHLGDQAVLGPGTVGTPSGMILAYSGTNGNYTGSIVSGNLIAHIKNGGPSGSIGRGIILEGTSNGWTLKDNVFSRIDGECVKLDASQVSTSNNVFVNNLFHQCGLQGGSVSGGGPGIWAGVISGKSASNNRIYNNTFVDNAGGAVGMSCAGTCTGNEIRNNIMFDSQSRKVVNWSAGGVFQRNIVHSGTTGTVVSFRGANWTCGSLVATADVDGDGSANDSVRCVDPRFVSLAGRDFHLASGSPAIDAATVTGLPAVRTASINNVLAGRHGFPSYADNVPLSGLGWDIGAVEVPVATVTASIVLSDPSPTGTGNVTVTLTTSVPVIQLPGPLTFTASDGSTRSIVLTGAVPGTVFAGTLVVDQTVPDGTGRFSLPLNNLVDASGNRGGTIVSGAETLIDQPPAAPANLRSVD